ncbi:hypothetical protein ADUPG1_009148 [Aduncisulcus paluster]|uniref:UBC core domain-containing protein n=1 Tax=Aduncisulcus paluster TaxID=2918883 RepID=A0ABQ5KVU8_9EUKA|nr:hypothetical protein ADUPG1_009148 [Aduncisulcus paluster]
MSITAARVQTELRRIARHPDENIIVKCDGTNMQRISAWLHGAKGTVYEKGQFELEFNIPENYPVVPLKVRMLTPIFHPNIDFRTGEICLDILKEREGWTPAWGILSVCRAILILLDNPDADSPLNCDAGNMVRAGDFRAYKSTSLMYISKFAMTGPFIEK